MDKTIVGIRFSGNRKVYHFGNPSNYPFQKNDKAIVVGYHGVFELVTVVSFNKKNFKPKKDIYPASNKLIQKSVAVSNERLPEL